MLPSRGLRWSAQTIGFGRQRNYLLPARQFSSVVQISSARRSPFSSTPSLANARLCTFSHTPRIKRSATYGSTVRFASTTPAAALPTVQENSSITSVSSSDILSSSQPAINSSLDEWIDVTKDSLHSTPEHIGYLKSLGLEYGYGPTALMEWTLEHVHVLAGTPWWLSITITAVLVRAVMFKAYIGAAENSAKMATILPITKPITDQATAARAAGDAQRASELQRELMQVYRRADIKLWKGFVPMLQVFAGYGTFVLLRAMARLPVPGLETGGIWWFHNLAYPDPYMVLPIATAGVLHWVLRKGGEMGVTTFSPAVFKLMMYGLPVLSLFATCFLPAALQLSFFVSGFLAYGQATLFRQPWFRSYFNMTPLPKSPPSGQSVRIESPYKGTLVRRADLPTTGSVVTKQSSQPVALRQGVDALRDGAKAPKIPSVLSGTVKDIMGTYQSARKTFTEATGGSEARTAKMKKREAERYEEKKREALKKERLRASGRGR